MTTIRKAPIQEAQLNDEIQHRAFERRLLKHRRSPPARGPKLKTEQIVRALLVKFKQTTLERRIVLKQIVQRMKVYKHRFTASHRELLDIMKLAT
jgi:hypothetical protein